MSSRLRRSLGSYGTRVMQVTGGEAAAAAAGASTGPTVVQIAPIEYNPYEMQTNDVLIIDNIAYQIRALSPVYYDYSGIDTTPLAAGLTRTDTITDLKPEDDEVYWFDAIGIDGPVTIQPIYPQGIPRQTPHNIPIYFDQTQGHKDNPLYVDIWVVPGTQPQLALSMPVTSPSSTSDVWFYGLKFKINILSQVELSAAIQSGSKVLEVTKEYQ